MGPKGPDTISKAAAQRVSGFFAGAFESACAAYQPRAQNTAITATTGSPCA